MRVAEALAERADLNKRIAQLTQRIKNSARSVEGEAPDEDPAELLRQIIRLMDRRQALVAEINHRNAQEHVIYQGREITVTEALALRDQMNAHRNLLHEIANAASPDRDRYGLGRRRTELPEKAALPVKELHEEADRIARDWRELDAAIQLSNWGTEL